MAIDKGTQAPRFTLKRKHSEGLDDLSLDSLLAEKKVVLLFFPLAFTSVCQDELCTISGGISEYENLNAAVVGISVDSPFAQEAFAKVNSITVPLLSDFNKEVSKAYGVLDEEFLPGKLGFLGVSKRSAFVIEQDGTISYVWSSDDPGQMPPFEEIKAALQG